MNIQNTKKTQVAIMNAVHDLPVLVARDKGFFKDEGLDLEFVTTPGWRRSRRPISSSSTPFSTARSTRSTTRAASINTGCANGAS